MIIATSLAGLITAIAATVSAVGGAVVSVLLIRKTSSTHDIVNSQRTNMQRVIQAQNKLLQSHGIELPDDESLT
jgi:hypothetical protein